MKTYRTLFSFIIMTFSIAGTANANERCGDNILSSAVTKVCFDYSAWHLRISYRDLQAPTSYPISPFSPATSTGGTLRFLEYEYKTERRGFYREVYRDVEGINSTNSRNWVLDYVEGVAPNGESFKYLTR